MRLADLTTLRLGGPATRFVRAERQDDLVAFVADADARGESVLLVGGGSNLLVADAGFDGLVIAVGTRGICRDDADEFAFVEVAAGEVWDDFVAWTVREGLSGLECLSGIPGSVGATPMQNVGAYGQEVGERIVSVVAYDREARATVELDAPACGFGYRSSMLKATAPRYVVLSATFRLSKSMQSAPIAYVELARALSLAVGERAEVGLVRETVLTLRRGKGMVLDPADPDSVSAGSFFMNPTLETAEVEALVARVRQRLGEHARVPCFPAAEGRTKVAAAWLIEQAGFSKGFGDGRVGISSKHALALVHRGGGSADELCALAARIRRGVLDAFGVTIHPEVQLVGCALPD